MQWNINGQNVFGQRRNHSLYEENSIDYITPYYLITWSQIDILLHEFHNQISFHHNLSLLFIKSSSSARIIYYDLLKSFMSDYVKL